MPRIPDVSAIFEHFRLDGPIVAIEPFGRGNIHATYRSTVRGHARQYVHQRLNTRVFREPEKVMANMALVTRHLRAQFAHQPGTRRRETLEIIPTRDGNLLHVDERGDAWRTTVCIPGIVTCDTIHSRDHAAEVGRTLGEFQRLLADLPAAGLHDTLPGFHHTPTYYADLLTAYQSTHANPALARRKDEAAARTLFEQICRHAALVPLLINAQRTGRIRERVAHNDPKVNNMLFDADTQQGVGMIDLDTVKAGLIHVDYGDCLRSAANPAGEDAHKIGQVGFDAEIFEAVTIGYLDEARGFLTDDDIDLLIDAVQVITLEQTIRFFADYVKGDVYYGLPPYPTRNLKRAQVQWALFQSMVHQEPALRKIVTRLQKH